MLVRGKMHSGEERTFKSRKSRLQSHLGSQGHEGSALCTALASLTQKASFYTMHKSIGPQCQPRGSRGHGSPVKKLRLSVLCVLLSVSPLS